MSRRTYPRIGSSVQQARWAKLPENQGPRCAVCGAKALFRVDVEVSYMRGDDEVFKACREHKDDAKALLATLDMPTVDQPSPVLEDLRARHRATHEPPREA